MAPHVLPYITAPLFGLNSHYDSWQTGCVLTPLAVSPNSTANGNCSAVPGWTACGRNPAACTPDQIPQYNRFRNALVSAYTATATAVKPGNGVFLTSCHTHCEAQDDPAWLKFAIGGTTMRDAFTAWMGATGEPAAVHTHVDCTYSTTAPFACNPTCN